MGPIRKNRRRNVWGFVLALLLGLIVGTLVGQDVGSLSHTWLGRALVLSPWTVNLYVVGIKIWIQTNAAGIILAFIGVLVYAAA